MKPNLNLHQQALFKEFLDPITLKAGKTKCPCCGKVMRAYAKTLDKRLIELLKEIGRHKSFKPRQLFNEDHQKINDFQKLGYWDLIEKIKGGWKITDKGRRFLGGEIGLPKKLWIFNRKAVLEEDERIDVNGADFRWQKERLDYTMDYIPHKPEVKFIERDGIRIAKII